MSMALIEEIQFDSEDYRVVLDWRERILRQPLGLVLSPDDTAGEDGHRHFVLREKEMILGGVIVMEVDRRTARLRQMWVRDDLEGKGYGRTLLEAIGRILEMEGIGRIMLHARLVVCGFYEKCGYIAEGEIFEEVGIRHIVMSRRLAQD